MWDPRWGLYEIQEEMAGIWKDYIISIGIDHQ